MCVKLPSKTLNPHAKEWVPLPTTKQYPRPPPPHPAEFNPAPPHYYSNYNVNVHTHTQFWPLYSVPFPAALEVTSRKANMAAKPKFSRSTMMEDPEPKSPKCPRASHFCKENGFKKSYPPRLLRLRRFYRVDKAPPQKLGWRPKGSVQANFNVSGEDGADHVPPPTLSGRPHPQNTTVMIKNIPNQLRRDFMLCFLDDYCRTHGLEYDFLYLPMDFSEKGNLGYAFVNFTTTVAAQKFKEILQGYKWATFYCHGRPYTSKKVCDITWARIQGLEALVERFKNSSFQCNRLDYLPVILNPPRNGHDPNPSHPVILGSLKKLVSDI